MIAATTSLSEARGQIWDTIVVGGGPAGSEPLGLLGYRVAARPAPSPLSELLAADCGYCWWIGPSFHATNSAARA